ncbi:MAG: hypothetical protein Q4Q04_04405, partial [Methanocorpusculum sp.]|nr:hypothetical protein [Methanocorpusculum sp.]
MPNTQAAHIGIEAIRKCLEDSAEATAFATRSELTEAADLLHQMKRAEELRQFEACGSEAEEELYDIFANLEDIHFTQGKVWALTVPLWKTVRNAMYLRTGICLSKGVIVRRYYDYTRPADSGDA